MPRNLELNSYDDLICQPVALAPGVVLNLSADRNSLHATSKDAIRPKSAPASASASASAPKKVQTQSRPIARFQLINPNSNSLNKQRQEELKERARKLLDNAKKEAFFGDEASSQVTVGFPFYLHALTLYTEDNRIIL